MLTDFYGKVLIAPTVLDHRRDAFDHALAQISQVTASHQIQITSWSSSRPGVITSWLSGLSRPLVMTCGCTHPVNPRHFRHAAHPGENPTIRTWKESSRPPVLGCTGWSIPPGNQSTARSSSGPDTGGFWSRNPLSSAARSWNTSNPASPDMGDVLMMFSSLASRW